MAAAAAALADSAMAELAADSATAAPAVAADPAVAATPAGVAAAVVATPGVAALCAGLLGIGSRRRRQGDVLARLVENHMGTSSRNEFLEIYCETDDFERRVPAGEHEHLAIALDLVLNYQRERRARGCGFMTMRKSYKHDPRTRLCEVLKGWLRTHADNASIGEDEIRGVRQLCRDVLHYSPDFPPRNTHSFMDTMGEVFYHMELQLKQVLEHDRHCAELTARAFSMGRNLVEDAIAYLLLAPTDLEQTDRLPSTAVVALWRSLPKEKNPLPDHADTDHQGFMKGHWETLCGSLVASLVSQEGARQLFGGAHAQDKAASVTKGPLPDELSALLNEVDAVRKEFGKGLFSNSGLAGPFRQSSQDQFRSRYLFAIEAAGELAYLLGVVLVQFQRISEGYGDYGTMVLAPRLHPFLGALSSKVQRFKGCLEEVNGAVFKEIVNAEAKGRRVVRPLPTDRMSRRADGCIDRAVSGTDSHASALLGLLEDLKARSAPARLPELEHSLGDACARLDGVLSSPQFKKCVSDTFPDLPSLRACQLPRAHRGAARLRESAARSAPA